VNEQLIMDGNLIDYALNDNPLSLPFSPINDPTNVHSYIYVFCLVWPLKNLHKNEHENGHID